VPLRVALLSVDELGYLPTHKREEPKTQW
jgi:hypothetical protein